MDHVHLVALYAICSFFMFYDSSEYFALFCFLCTNIIFFLTISTISSFTIIVTPFLPRLPIVNFILSIAALLIFANATLFNTLYRLHQRSFSRSEKVKWNDHSNYALKKKCKIMMIIGVVLLHILIYARNLRNNVQVLILAFLLVNNLYNCILTLKLYSNTKVETTSDLNFPEKNAFLWK